MKRDNVILALHQGDKIQKSIKKVDKRDEEHRVWYVGITRARNNLYKLKSKNKKEGVQTMRILTSDIFIMFCIVYFA